MTAAFPPFDAVSSDLSHTGERRSHVCPDSTTLARKEAS
jgi:hypothetical protein